MYIAWRQAEEVNGADAVAEEAVRALAHWNGSDFADAVFQQLQDVLREDFVKLVQEVRVMHCTRDIQFYQN